MQWKCTIGMRKDYKFKMKNVYGDIGERCCNGVLYLTGEVNVMLVAVCQYFSE